MDNVIDRVEQVQTFRLFIEQTFRLSDSQSLGE